MSRILKSAVRAFYPYKYSSLYRLIEPRKFHAYCIGTAKSGTHSMASIFSESYRSAHEEAYGALIERYLSWRGGQISAESFRDFLSDHDRFAWLEMDSSHVHIEYIDLLVELFPKAKFILTIRDCFSWLESFLNHSINYPDNEMWKRLYRWQYGKRHFSYESSEAVLKEYSFFPLKSYFSTWDAHNRRAINVVPSERLLVVRTSDISRQIDQLASFLEVTPSSLSVAKSHSFKAPKKQHILSSMDHDYVKQVAQTHCGELMNRYFSDEDYLERLLRG